MNKSKWFLNGGRGSGRTFRLLCETYENKITDLQHKQKIKIADLEKENAKLKENLNRYKHDCPNCSAFAKHCPHKVNGDPYFYDCYLTVEELEQENAELKEKWLQATDEGTSWAHLKCLEIENVELKELIKNIIRVTWGEGWNYSLDWKVKAEQYLKDLEK